MTINDETHGEISAVFLLSTGLCRGQRDDTKLLTTLVWSRSSDHLSSNT
jgi:hypothetical protein